MTITRKFLQIGPRKLQVCGRLCIHTTSSVAQAPSPVKQQTSQQGIYVRATRAIPNVVLVDAVRTPFTVSNTHYKELMAVDLQRHSLKG